MLKEIEKKYPYFATFPGVMINTHKLELPLSRTYFSGPKGVRVIENLPYMYIISDVSDKYRMPITPFQNTVRK